MVVSVDAKSGIQALDPTQPLLTIDFGKTQKHTFDYARMGTTDLYAGIDIRTGKVITSLAQTHATPDFLRLMNKVVARKFMSSWTMLPCTCRRTLRNGSPSSGGELSSTSLPPVRRG